MTIRKVKTLLCFLLCITVCVLLLRQQTTKAQLESSEFSSKRSGDSCVHGSKRLAIIVPFRERFNQLLAFVPHMNTFLDRQQVCHEFYIVNQIDEFRFNRGQLINVGFILASNSSDYIVIHDVDLLPLNDKLSYRYPQDGIFHVSGPQLHPKYHYEKFIGGIVIIRNDHFARINGFSNVYWGWGLEDDEFYTRIVDSGLKIHRPVGIVDTDSSNTFLHLHNDREHKRDTAKLFNQREVTRKKDRRTGISTVDYQLVNVHRLSLQDVTFRVFDVALNCDQQQTPWCSKPASSAGKKATKQLQQQQQPPQPQ